ncbi:MAG: hypothetical protein GY789_30240 [Hyphomicrobiales bacterium]|nr:hypothetical protein [Hyphomicrobiales bacterium]
MKSVTQMSAIEFEAEISAGNQIGNYGLGTVIRRNAQLLAYENLSVMGSSAGKEDLQFLCSNFR